MDCAFGRTRSTEQYGVYYVTFAYREESAGIFAAKAAVNIVETLAAGERYDIEKDMHTLKTDPGAKGFVPSTLSIVTAAEKKKYSV